MTSLWLFCFAIVLPVRSAVADTGQFESKVDDLVERTLGCRDIVGLSLTVVQGNRTVLAKGYGQKELQNNNEVSGKSLFGIASLSKAFTSALLGQVLHENNLTWDTPVKDILGSEFAMYDKLRTNHVTCRDLGAHRTGYAGNNFARMQQLTRRDMMIKLRYFPPALDFRSSYKYNNLMYGLMTYITEKLGGDTWETLMQERLFKPLGMVSSTLTHVTNLSRTDMAMPYMKRKNGEWKQVAMSFHSDWGELGGSGSVMSNAEDMANWLKLHLASSSDPDQHAAIDREMLQETHRSSNPMPQTSYAHQYMKPQAPATFQLHSYGLGWKQGAYRGLRLSQHTGTSWGYGGLITVLHDADIAIFTAITGTDYRYTGRYLLHLYIIDLLLGEEPWIDLETVCTFPQPWTPPHDNHKETPKQEVDTNVPLIPLERYTGTYGNYGYGNITVNITDHGQLKLRYGLLGCWDLEWTGNHSFHGKGCDFVWMRDVKYVRFSTIENHNLNTNLQDTANSKSELVTEVEIYFDKVLPPVFTRGLMMHEAPPGIQHDAC